MQQSHNQGMKVKLWNFGNTLSFAWLACNNNAKADFLKFTMTV